MLKSATGGIENETAHKRTAKLASVSRKADGSVAPKGNSEGLSQERLGPSTKGQEVISMKEIINQMRLENRKAKQLLKSKRSKASKKKTNNELSKEWQKNGIASDAFLSTFEWRKVRMQALKKYGAKCQCCGVTPDHGAVMNVDHIKPRKLFPNLALDLNNLQVLCHDCNHGKGNWDMTDWRSTKEKFLKIELKDVELKIF